MYVSEDRLVFPLVFVFYLLMEWTDSPIHTKEVQLDLDKSALSLWLVENVFFGMLPPDGMNQTAIGGGRIDKNEPTGGVSGLSQFMISLC